MATGICRTVFPVTERLLELGVGKAAAAVPLSRPIIIVGPERSGTTLVYSLLSNHPDLYTLTNAAERFPDYPLSASLLRRMRCLGRRPSYAAVPSSTGAIQGRGFVPTEGIGYWHSHLGSRNGGWRNAPDDYFGEEDLDDNTREMLPLDLKKRMYMTGKKRLLLKQPGFSLKIRYLNSLFPDAIFVHCLRNPFTNFASLLDRKTRHQNSDWGLKVPDWRKWSDLPVEERTARQLSVTYDIIRQSIAQIPDGARRCVTVRYGAFRDSFTEEVRMLFERCGLQVPSHVIDNPGVIARRDQKPVEVQNERARLLLEELSARMGYANQ